MLGCEQQRTLRAQRKRYEDRGVSARRVHYRQRVGGEMLLVVGRGVVGPVGASIPASVEGEHSTVPRQVGNLHLPVTRVDYRPGGEQEYRRLAASIHLVEQPDAIAFDEPLLIGIARP